MTDSMIDYTTIFESTRNLPKNIVLGHGENADLVAAFTDNGVGVALSGFTARAIYQPKSKWGTDEWFECPCDISGDTAVAHWGNTYDNGENAVRMFLQLSKGGTVAYPAIYHIRLFETPGFAPSAIEPIPETIDFSEYILLNAPWPTEGELQAKFVPLSGNAMLSGNLSTDYDIYRRETKTVTYKNIQATNDTEEYFEADVYISYNTDNAEDLVTIDPSATIPITIKSKLVETGEDVTINAVLTSPEQYIEGQVKWNVTADGTTIGIIVFAENTPFPMMIFANVHDDYIMSPVYIVDTTEEVTEENPYIYDVSNLATKTEVRALKAETLSSLQTLDNSITGLGNRITAVESNLDYSLSTGNGIHSRTVLSAGNKTADFVIFLSEQPKPGKAFDGLADVSNTGSNPLSVTLSYETVWRLAIDEGIDFNELMTIPAGTSTRFYFTQTGFTSDNKPVLHISRKDIKFVEV